MKYNHVFFISPPFYSHFNPLLHLAKSFKRYGVEVTFGCSIEFKESVLHENLNFYQIDISKNKNIGNNKKALQDDSETKRLEEFFESTKKGAIETLITQSHHRRADMLYDPEILIDEIKNIHTSHNIDLYVVDVLSYSVTLSLYFLHLPFITFCPPHPDTIVQQDAYYGVPRNWPTVFTIGGEELKRLQHVSTSTTKEFTEVFNSIISRNKEIKTIQNAFNVVSEIAVVYNYFDFYQNERVESNKLFIGHSFDEKQLGEEWKKRIETKEKIIMITLGTFLSNRVDVLEKLIVYTRKRYPQALIIVSAGMNVEPLKHYASKHTIIEEFIPQIALMPYIDTVIFHGGCNTLTETIYYGKKMIILPFSSDQFNIAYDVEKNKLGAILDPNNFSREDFFEACHAIEHLPPNNTTYWQHISKERGADYAVKNILMKQ